MKNRALVEFSLKKPKLVIAISAILTLILMSFMPKVQFDNDPENMLSKDEPIRTFHNKVKEKYNLYDFVIVGIVNEHNENGVFNVDTLNKVYDLTKELESLHKDEQGRIVVRKPSEKGSELLYPDLKAKVLYEKALNMAFKHNPEALFIDGESVIIASEIISPAAIDNIRQADLGSLKIEYLMEERISSKEEADRIRNDAMNNPLYKDTIVSQDGKALCLYIPIKDKKYSYNVATLVRKLTEDWKNNDVYITGLPVAEDTFGVEMLKQMAISAPMAGIMIFLMLWFFFRKIRLIIAPLIVAVFSVICTMGLLIGLGFKVHIMSSMIAIFLMPIAVVDSVHILSEFFDVYHRFKDKKETIRYVVGHLYMPMLYTSLTTLVGFASLATTPIPPVQVFGLHVAFGVALAWLLTMSFVPAFIMVFVSNESLKAFEKNTHEDGNEIAKTKMAKYLEATGRFTYNKWKLIAGITLVIIAISVTGISKININDNPVKWFTENHEIRVADRVLNEHFGGTYTAYITFASDQSSEMTCREKAEEFRKAARKKYKEENPEVFIKLNSIFDNIIKNSITYVSVIRINALPDF